ncbi:hypothetical protein D5086_016326 [Populus alba]|uniref:Uncharacterized protein n=1 Tax=Populus alba TaxID=43335 RepID=A0ACC4BV54_POPAL
MTKIFVDMRTNKRKEISVELMLEEIGKETCADTLNLWGLQTRPFEVTRARKAVTAEARVLGLKTQFLEYTDLLPCVDDFFFKNKYLSSLSFTIPTSSMVLEQDNNLIGLISYREVQSVFKEVRESGYYRTYMQSQEHSTFLVPSPTPTPVEERLVLYPRHALGSQLLTTKNNIRFTLLLSLFPVLYL